jgi:phosphogluconate dehydratase
MAFLTRELLDAGLLHEDVVTAAGDLRPYAREPWLNEGVLDWREPPAASLDPDILRPVSDPFDAEGGLRVLRGNLGRSVIKVSAVAPEHRVIEAPAIVFHDQDQFLAAFKAGELNRDFVAVIRFQGPRANGMPELHKLTPQLSVLQGQGRKVALVTDGRMSGASGRVPAAIHVTPEAVDEGPIARIRAGDIIRLDAERATLDVKLDQAELMARDPERHVQPQFGMGRELFAPFRRTVGGAEAGAGVFFQ